MAFARPTRRGNRKDPDGLDVEVIQGHAAASRPFESPLVRGFVTDGQGLGHVVLSTGDPERSVEFYRFLGFKLSDLIQANLGPDMAVTISFLHCNPRHHTLAFARLPVPRRLEHLMLEVRSVDEVIEAYNRMAAPGLFDTPSSRTTSKRPDAEFYVVTPSGFDVEVGWDGQRVASDWVVRTYDRVSLWGHEVS